MTKKYQLIIALMVALATGIVLWAIGASVGGILNRWWLLVIPIPALLIGFNDYTGRPDSVRASVVGVASGMVLMFFYMAGRVMWNSFLNPPPFDFPHFWVCGRAALTGQNFYDQNVLLELAKPFNFPDYLLEELFCVFPPPTLLLYMPLGLMELRWAQIPWGVANLIILIMAVVVLWQVFSSRDNLAEIVLVLALLVGLQASLLTVKFNQNVFIVLLLTALFWRDRNSWHSGMWWSLSILIKPFLVLFFTYFLLRKNIRAFVAAFATGVVLLLVSFIIFEPAILFSYRGTVEMPEWWYSINMDHSLSAVVIRLTQNNLSQLSNIIFIGLALLLSIITLYLVIRVRNLNADLIILTLILTWALIVVPHILRYYGVFFIFPVLLVWHFRQKMPGGLWTSIVLIMSIYISAGFKGGSYMIVTSFITWGIAVGMAFFVIINNRDRNFISAKGFNPFRSSNSTTVR